MDNLLPVKQVLLDILHKTNNKWVSEVVILQRSYTVQEFDPLLMCEYYSIDEVKNVIGNPNHDVTPVVDIRNYLRENNMSLSEELISYYN